MLLKDRNWVKFVLTVMAWHRKKDDAGSQKIDVPTMCIVGTCSEGKNWSREHFTFDRMRKENALKMIRAEIAFLK